jgi:hypothetical protein
MKSLFPGIYQGNRDKKNIMDDHPETMEYLDFNAFEIRQERFKQIQLKIHPKCKKRVQKSFLNVFFDVSP